MLTPKLVAVIIIISISILSAGCSNTVTQSPPLIEVSDYSVEQVFLGDEPEIYIVCDNANIKIFTWDSQEARIEIKKRARGKLDKELLREKLEDFNIDIRAEGNKLFFNSSYKQKVKFPSERIIDLVLYIPKRVTLLDYNANRGSLKIYDDINCTLQAHYTDSDIDVNKFSGTLDIRGNTGNVLVYGGKISGSSSIKLENGNIKIKAQFDNGGDYNFETGLGNIELALPKNSGIRALCIGQVDINEFQSLKYPAAIRLKNNMGRLSAISF